MYNLVYAMILPFAGLLRLFAGRCAAFAAVIMAIISAGVLLGGCVADGDEESASLAVGEKCPFFEVMLSDGRIVSTADLAGRRTMIVFFNTGCEDCRRELPVIQRVADALAADGATGLAGQLTEVDEVPRVFCVSRSEGAASVAAYWAENGLSLPYSAQTDSKVYRQFAESIIPRIYIIGCDLTIIAAFAEKLPDGGALLELMR